MPLICNILPVQMPVMCDFMCVCVVLKITKEVILCKLFKQVFKLTIGSIYWAKQLLKTPYSFIFHLKLQSNQDYYIH